LRLYYSQPLKAVAERKEDIRISVETSGSPQVVVYAARA
jgi:hypothetical protein